MVIASSIIVTIYFSSLQTQPYNIWYIQLPPNSLWTNTVGAGGNIVKARIKIKGPNFCQTCLFCWHSEKKRDPRWTHKVLSLALFIQLPLLNIQVYVINKNQATSPPALWGVGDPAWCFPRQGKAGRACMVSWQFLPNKIKPEEVKGSRSQELCHTQWSQGGARAVS